MPNKPPEPVKMLFQSLPDPSLWYTDSRMSSSWPTPLDELEGCISRFVHRCSKAKARAQPFEDPDADFLYEKLSAFLREDEMAKMSHDLIMISVLGQLADKKRLDITRASDGSRKDQYLRIAYYMTRGSRDPEHPFRKEAAAALLLEQQTEQPRLPPREHYATLVADNARTAALNSKCANCGNTKKAGTSGGGLVRCADCLVDEEWSYMAVCYCDDECRAAHRAAHQAVCTERARLAGAVAVVQALSRQFHARTFGGTFEKITVGEGRIHLKQYAQTHGRAGWRIIPEAFKGGFVFTDPPRGIAGSALAGAADYDNAILQFRKFAEHSSVEWPFIGMFLEPICTSISEFFLFPKNASIIISDTVPGGSLSGALFQHHVLCAAMPSGAKYIIDLAGAQFGWRETLAPAAEYLGARSSAVHRIGARGLGIAQTDAFWRALPGDGPERAGRELKEDLARVVAAEVQRFLAAERLTTTMTRTPLAIDAGERLLRATDAALTAILDMHRALGRYCFCLSKHEYVRVTNNTADAMLYRKLWLTEEQWEPIKHNPNRLMRLWRTRVMGFVRAEKKKGVEVSM